MVDQQGLKTSDGWWGSSPCPPHTHNTHQRHYRLSGGQSLAAG